MLASKRARVRPESELVLPAPRQRVFAQLNVRIDPTLDARLRRYCLMFQVTQAQSVGEAIDAYLKAKGH
jgi:hypothetical protein